MYLENAKTAFAALNETFFKNGTYKGTMFWDRAELLEMVEDFCEKDSSYNDLLQEFIDTSMQISGSDWSNNPFYDDILWMCLAFARAATILNKPSYLSMAKSNLDYVTRQGINEYGLIEWKEGAPGSNTISSVNYVVASSMIGKALNDNSYLDRAKNVLDKVMESLYNPENGHVFDHFNADGTIEYFAHDSNFGMFVRACAEVYDYTNDTKYYDAMQLAATHLITLKYFSGVMCNHDQGDGAGFKAIFVRQVGYIARKYGLTDYLDWLRFNADTVWNNRNKYNLMHNDFCTKTPDHKLWRALDCHSAVTLLIACAE